MSGESSGYQPSFGRDNAGGGYQPTFGRRRPNFLLAGPVAKDPVVPSADTSQPSRSMNEDRTTLSAGKGNFLQEFPQKAALRDENTEQAKFTAEPTNSLLAAPSQGTPAIASGFQRPANQPAMDPGPLSAAPAAAPAAAAPASGFKFKFGAKKAPAPADPEPQASWANETPPSQQLPPQVLCPRCAHRVSSKYRAVGEGTHQSVGPALPAHGHARGAAPPAAQLLACRRARRYRWRTAGFNARQGRPETYAKGLGWWGGIHDAPIAATAARRNNSRTHARTPARTHAHKF